MKSKVTIHKKHSASRARYQLKRRRWHNGIRRRKGGARASRKPLVFVEHPAPQVFDLMPENAEATIKYINLVKKIGGKRKGVDFNLKEVTSIGVGAISMLLSVMAELRGKGIRFRGTKPTNKNAKDTLERSGFMRYVSGKISLENRKTKNTIFTGKKRTHHTMILNAIHTSNETVWGLKGRNQLLYGMLVEMIKNSCKHAFQSDKDVRWHIAVNHDEENNRVKFSFVDNGIGVIKSHQKGDFFKQVTKVFSNLPDFIEGAYTEGIRSKTGLSWRGTGLPFIYESFDENVISNFVVITNEAYINFQTEEKKSLKNAFSGTYYYFEVNTECLKQCFPIEYDRN